MATRTLVTESQPEFVDDSRYERIDGRIVERPVPRRKHAQVQLNVVLLLSERLRELGGKVLQEWSLAQPETADQFDPNYMMPDVSVALPPIREALNGYLLPPALLAIEVSSPGQFDLIRKAQRYVSWGIEHVWIINPDTRECFEHHGGNTFVIAQNELHAGPVTLSTAEVFAGIDDSV